MISSFAVLWKHTVLSAKASRASRIRANRRLRPPPSLSAAKQIFWTCLASSKTDTPLHSSGLPDFPRMFCTGSPFQKAKESNQSNVMRNTATDALRPSLGAEDYNIPQADMNPNTNPLRPALTLSLPHRALDPLPHHQPSCAPPPPPLPGPHPLLYRKRPSTPLPSPAYVAIRGTRRRIRSRRIASLWSGRILGLGEGDGGS